MPIEQPDLGPESGADRSKELEAMLYAQIMHVTRNSISNLQVSLATSSRIVLQGKCNRFSIKKDAQDAVIIACGGSGIYVNNQIEVTD